MIMIIISITIRIFPQGDKHLSEWLKYVEEQHKGKVCGYAGFDPKVGDSESSDNV